jgi:hypothetical protein
MADAQSSPIRKRSTFANSLFSHFVSKQLDDINSREFKDSNKILTYSGSINARITNPRIQ